MEQVFETKKECSGCTACYTICPRKAITMKEDEKGFKYPVIDKTKCINCGKCIKVCPIKNEITRNTDKKQVYAAKNKILNDRLKSSSGGVFIELARYIISNEGCIFGAIYNKENKVVHAKVDKEEDIEKLLKSKYVQSDISNTYKEVKCELENNRYVLFSGTPCQIVGLLKTVPDNYKEKLITCDIVCHGVPSPKVFDNYKKILEKKYKSRIINIDFRHKNEHGLLNLLVNFENKKKYEKKNLKDSYYKMFSRNYTLRESCYYCKFSNMDRVSDITIGDFWGIERTIKGFEDKKGVSLVIVNTEKGKKLFDRVKDKFELKESNEKDCLQPNLMHPTSKPNNLDKFWQSYIKNGYNQTMKKFTIYLTIVRIKNKIRKELCKVMRKSNGKK